MTPPRPPLLRCPHCARPLAGGERSWRCEAGHSFDVAKQGYVNLLTGAKHPTGDTAAMIAAREAVLAAGHLESVTRALVAACGSLPDGALLEVGAGTAHHLVRVRRALDLPRAVAMDVSVPAAKRAGRADPDHVTAVVADVWRPWPLLDGVAAAVLMVFAPRNAEEAARVLVPGGRLVVVTPAPDHLQELRGPLGLLRIEPGKDARLLAELDPHLDHLDTREVRAQVTVDRAGAAALAAMGPAGHHLDADDLAARAAALPPATTATVAVHVTRFAQR